MLEEEILMAKGKNWARLVAQRADELCRIKQSDPDLMVHILTGEIFDSAVEQIGLEIRAGVYDKMLMPKECNL